MPPRLAGVHADALAPATQACLSNEKHAAWSLLSGAVGRFLPDDDDAPVQGAGYAVSLVGFFWYNYVKINTMAGPTPLQKAHSSYSQLPTKEPSRS